MLDTNTCYLSNPAIHLRRTAAIGDCVAALCVAQKLKWQGHNVSFQCAPGIAPVIRRSPYCSVIEPTQDADINLDGVYENHPDRRTRSFWDLFIESANTQLGALGINLGKAINCTPILRCDDPPPVMFTIGHPRPYIMVCPRSHHYAPRTVHDGTWIEIARHLPGTKFWLGLNPAPPGFVDTGCRDTGNLCTQIRFADLMVSVDTGPLHIAAALGVPCVALGQASSPELHITDQRDFVTIWPEGLNCLNCQKNICPKDAMMPPCQHFNTVRIVEEIRARTSPPKVSAVIAVYRPEYTVLSKCLQSVVDQVDEVVVARDTAGSFPDTPFQHPKVRYITKQAHDLGYGRKANFAARHSHGRYLLLMNDDVYLEPDAVSKLMEHMKPGVGIVCGKLTYPSGKLYPVTKLRVPGKRDMHFPDVNRFDPTLTNVTEIEACSGCVILVDRRAFFNILGFDERYYLYCEDDDLCMRMRYSGKKIIWTPASLGIHDEHRSTAHMPHRYQIMAQSGGLFHSTWDWYFDKNNSNSNMGVFA